MQINLRQRGRFSACVLAFASLLLIAGCAGLAPAIPEGYKGPIAWLADTGFAEGRGKGAFFAALALDGRTIENSLLASRRASYGQGFVLTSRYEHRELPARPSKITITGTHKTAAPIHEIAARMVGTFFSVEGVVDFDPEAGKNYIVTGELTKELSCVWIAENISKKVVTEKVCTK
jgi:hypothetical protein